MTRICKNCNFENQDSYDFCAKCGKPLVEDVQLKQFYVYDSEPDVHSGALILSYIVTIFFSWSGFVVGLVSKNTAMSAFTFFGFFMPFYLLQSKSKKLRYHGYIQLLISLIGVALSFYIIFY